MQNEGVENKKWWIACCKGQRTEKEPPNEDGKQKSDKLQYKAMGRCVDGTND